MAARKPGKVGWGIMSTALIGTRVVIPAMMRSNKFEFRGCSEFRVTGLV